MTESREQMFTNDHFYYERPVEALTLNFFSIRTQLKRYNSFIYRASKFTFRFWTLFVADMDQTYINMERSREFLLSFIFLQSPTEILWPNIKKRFLLYTTSSIKPNQFSLVVA